MLINSTLSFLYDFFMNRLVLVAIRDSSGDELNRQAGFP